MDSIAKNMETGEIKVSLNLLRRCLEAMDGLAVMLVDASVESADLDGIAAIIETSSALAEQQLSKIDGNCDRIDNLIERLKTQGGSHE